ncbi:type III-B CRISPR module RAMP protein Cmr1 [Tepiditoga spiralis]|uniref:Type III-B CRISPR module RAMP protein Cmr1 n=1 Tax=Tepiditoga spiralis TaxID=2108365 RepID=A0A7G1G5L4_9BACT|nr:type III-B CRISPR module RAMP protein Cmr1 [Tepiditoga spiralis]BBE30576.1 type III-B CRISPR module RAMP protein Cmr1 [Tepiditoga spiralis]
MKKLDIEIKTISPMFSGRGDKKFALTPQSVRGVLRFWFRAILPRVVNIVDNNGNSKLKGEECFWNYKLLKDIESYIFGSTEIKSPFDVLVKYDKKDISDKQGKSLTNDKYNKYALYGQEDRYYLKENSKINIKFIIKKNISGLDKLLFYLLNLTSYLGGFGAKSRKGFGSFEIIKSNEYKIINTKSNLIKNLEEVLKEIIENMKKNYNNEKYIFEDKTLKKNFYDLNNIDYDIQNFTSSPTYPTLLSKKYVILESKNKFDTFLELYDYLYKPDPKTRYLNKDNSLKLNVGMYIKLKKVLRGKYVIKEGKIKSNEKLDEDSFRKGIYSIKNHENQSIQFVQSFLGLPINYKIGDRQFKGINSGNYTLSNSEGRKASQMFIKIYKENGKYRYRISLIRSKITNKNSFVNGKKIEDIKFNKGKNEFKVKGNENLKMVFDTLKNLKIVD